MEAEVVDWSHMGNENWCMIGYHSVSVLADAITKGLPIDKQEAVKAMVSSFRYPYATRPAADDARFGCNGRASTLQDSY